MFRRQHSRVWSEGGPSASNGSEGSVTPGVQCTCLRRLEVGKCEGKCNHASNRVPLQTEIVNGASDP